MDDVSIDRCKQVAPIAESALVCGEKNLLRHMTKPALYWSSWLRFMLVSGGPSKRKAIAYFCEVRTRPRASAAHLSAAAHRELFEDANVIDENAHEPEFV